MLKRVIFSGIAITCLGAAGLATPAVAQTCAPLDNGRLADVFYEGTVVFFNPVVEFREMVLTIGGPCEDIVKHFTPKDEISFDLREIARLTDGQYTWELRRVSSIDPGVQKDIQQARGTGEEDAIWWSYFQKGAIPAGPYTDSGSFTVERGVIVDPGSGEEKRAALTGKASAAAQAGIAATTPDAGASEGGGGNPLSTKDTVLTNANGVIRNSLCVGFDCANSNTYSDTTVLLTENNTRIKFDDTSSVNSFPRNDWEIEANSNANGGASYLGFNDCGQSSGGGCASDLVFAVEAGAPTSALYVESDGDVGFGTNNPVVRLHATDGDSPALRLEQTGSSGFAPQTWDVAGNETNFFVRDVTSGSRLPFRIRPGAPSNSINIAADGKVGIGTASPDAQLHVKVAKGDARIESTGSATSDHASLFLESSGGTTTTEFEIRANASTGSLEIRDAAGATTALKFQPGAANNSLVVGAAAGGFARVGIGTTNPQGDAGEHSLDVNGSIYQRGAQLHSDYVFEPDYKLESIEDHASYMWAHRHLPSVPGRQVDEKGREVIELGAHRRGMLEELEKAHIYIEKLNEKIEERDRELASLKEQLARINAALSLED